MDTEYLIIGNTAGGTGAVEAIRQVDGSSPLVIVSDEPYPAYSRPLISKYLSRERSLESMLLRPAGFYSDNNIVTLLGRTVESLDLRAHTAELDSGDRVSWRKLLLATGGVPIVPPIKGANRRGVFTFTTIDDAKAIDSFLPQVYRAVVIGGGLIGISVTEALSKRGIDVTVVEMKERILNTILDEQASGIAEETLKRAGIRLICQHTVVEITGKPLVEGVTLNDGRSVPCEMVVIAIGVSPRVELARNTEIKVSRGIVVDGYMATTCPDVYCCGDAAEAYDFVYGQRRPTPIWPNAYIGGMTAGYNMAGVKKEYPGGTAMNSLNYFGLDITSAGLVIPPDGEGYDVLTKWVNGAYQKIVLKDGMVVGMAFVKEIEKSGMVFGLMRDRVNVSSFSQSLLAEDFGLACLPRELWEERLEVLQDVGVSTGDSVSGGLIWKI